MRSWLLVNISSLHVVEPFQCLPSYSAPSLPGERRKDQRRETETAMASLILLGSSSVKFKTHSEDLSALHLQVEFLNYRTESM